jgi:hypothetical protein
VRIRLPVLSLAALWVYSVASAAEPRLVVTTDPQSRPESITVGRDGSLFLGSMTKPVIYQAPKGASPAKVFAPRQRCLFAPRVLPPRPLVLHVDEVVLRYGFIHCSHACFGAGAREGIKVIFAYERTLFRPISSTARLLPT